ncbi:hypothetical protein SOVF_189300, partial [Spinacia oleracea]
MSQEHHPNLGRGELFE